MRQRFRIPSAIAQAYEAQLGQFNFIVEVQSLELRYYAPYLPPIKDVCFKSIDPGFHDKNGYECYCLAHGHDRYGSPEMNYSPDLINGGTWYLPNLFCWQSWFMYLWLYDVVTPIE